jgi:HK97 family phage prohead protease
MIEIRSKGVIKADKGQIMRGYASTFDTPYPIGHAQEIITRGAFGRTLTEKPDVVALVNHDQSMPIARTTNGSLELEEDERGLAVRINPIDTSYAKDLMIAVRSGVVNSMSFGFVVKDDAYENRNGQMYRMVKDLDLVEVSVVTIPANPAATLRVDTRSFDIWQAAQAPRRVIRRVFRIVPPR